MFVAYRYLKKKRASQASTVHGAQPAEPNQDSLKHTQTQQQPESVQVAQQDQDASAARRYRWKLILCLSPAFFLASLDLTIISPALPFIASHYNKFNQLNWIVTAFTLTSTAFIPFFGQLADTFGRHSTIQFGTATLTIGSILCAAAPEWGVLLLGRALQGVGTAGITNVTFIILADGVTLAEQAKNVSIFQLINGVGYSVGPVVGGYLTNAKWRYCFVLCAGMGVVSSVTIFLLRSSLQHGSISIRHDSQGRSKLGAIAAGLSTLDFGGIILFILGIGLIILGTAWGGSTFAWSSSAVIVSLVLGCVLCSAFIVFEYLLESGRFLAVRLPKTVPLVPFSILKNKDVAIVNLITASSGAAIYSVFYFIGIYFTLVEAYPASRAGIQLLYYIPGIGFGVYAAIFLCNFWPRHTFWPLFLGTIVEVVGLAVLTYAVKTRNNTLVNVMMGVSGAGTGARFMPSSLHMAGMFRDQIAPVYSLLRFSLPFGGTIALTIMGSVFQNKMAVYFGQNSGADGFNLHDQASLDVIKHLPAAEQTLIRDTGANATMWAFISILPILGLSLIASFGLGNVKIAAKKSAKDQEALNNANNQADNQIWDGVYLLNMGHSGRRVTLQETEK